MCGICGEFRFDENEASLDLVFAMSESLKHRGPDGEGHYRKGRVGLGHRRLSIIDLSGGTQPISNENNTIQLVFNGEIYNYIELRSELRDQGHHFTTASDSEVIVHAYEEWGLDCVRYFNGIFAFALWDEALDRLFLARDHLGVKPLYYWRTENRLLFASEIKAILQDDLAPRRVDKQALAELFSFRYVPSPRTLFDEIRKIPPGHFMAVSPKGVVLKRFWEWTPRLNAAISEQEAIEEYQHLLADAVRLQLRSDVPLGLFLSSGIDSGVLLALMSENSSKPVHTFTIGFEDGQRTNELEGAKQYSQMFGSVHTEMIVGPEDYEAYYDRYLYDLEEPVGNETAAAFYFVASIASQQVKVALTGQGADEPWAGYHRYIGVKLSQLYAQLPAFLTRTLLLPVIMQIPRAERLKRGAISLNEPDLMARFTKIYSFFSSEMKEQLFQESFKECLQVGPGHIGETLHSLQSDVTGLDPVTQMLYIDTRANLPDDLLMVGDKTSMANSLEARVPFLDYRLIQFIETLPSNLKLRGFQGKYLHKKALQKWLPKKEVYKKKKGFANPISEWLRARMRPLLEEQLLAPEAAVQSYFRQDYIRQLVEQHLSGREDYLRQLYLLLSFEMWHRRFIGVERGL